MLGVSASSEIASSLQSDVLAGLWQELQEAAAAVAEDDDDDDDSFSETDTDEPSQHQQTAPQTAEMVGPTATELESIKELIQFDHEYIKPVQVHFTSKPVDNNDRVNVSPVAASANRNNLNTTNNRSVAAKSNSKPKKMVSVVNVNISAATRSQQPEPVVCSSTNGPNPVLTLATPDAGLDLPDFFETEDILNFNDDLIKDIDIDKLLTGGIIDNEVSKQQPVLSSSISQDNTRKRKCSDDSESSTATVCSAVKQPRVSNDFCFQTLVKFDDIFSSQNAEIKPDSVVGEMSEVGSPASVVSSSSSHDDLWEESFSELFPTLI